MKAYIGDLTKLNNIEVIVNAANGMGIMGAGIAGAIARAAGKSLKDDIYNLIETTGSYKAGECYASIAGSLSKNGVIKVYHAVTMTRPGGETSIEVICSALKNTLNKAILEHRKSIAIPGLGTGIGGLDKKQVANKMVEIALEYKDKIDIHIVDMDANFIKSVNENIEYYNKKVSNVKR